MKESTHPAIVEKALFDRVQGRFATNRKRTSPNRAYVLSGLVKCGGCDGPMVGYMSSSGAKYYCCGRYWQFGRASLCPKNSVREDRLLSAVADKLAEAYFNPANLSALRDEVRRQERATDAPSRADQLTARIEELKKKVAAGVRRLIDLPAELSAEFEAGLVELRQEQTRLERELETVRAAEVPAEDLDARIDTILERMTRFRELLSADPEGANVVLREMIDRVVLHFRVDERKSKTLNRFARGAIYLSESSSLTAPNLSGVKAAA